MWVSRKKYQMMDAALKMVPKLEEEISRLANQITDKTEDCAMGEWCKDCAHLGTDHSRATAYKGDPVFGDYITYQNGTVKYCKKHLHEICPEFDIKPKDRIII